MSDALSIALPFKNVDVTVASPLANATQAYVADGKVQSTYAFAHCFRPISGVRMVRYAAVSGRPDGQRYSC